ncbi:protein THEM6-like [Drosophila hydei]|uniref:Protein THEM6 n=1 Tax=Drosophila hydei TaxID=7224 RepID=A0A6J1M5L5_DROHY|nr:protein THEM6-like [Drosophila hydei]
MNYFIRCGLTLLMVRLFNTRHTITDKTTIYGICTTQDVDIYLRHMNNARYLRDLNFANIHYYITTDVYNIVCQSGGSIIISATTIRYRRFLPLFQPYKVDTRLIWWDDKAMYFEQQFVSLFTGFVHAIALSKHLFINYNVFDLVPMFKDTAQRPDIPDELKLWLEANDESSKKLRGKGLSEDKSYFDCRASFF